MSNLKYLARDLVLLFRFVCLRLPTILVTVTFCLVFWIVVATFVMELLS